MNVHRQRSKALSALAVASSSGGVGTRGGPGVFSTKRTALALLTPDSCSDAQTAASHPLLFSFSSTHCLAWGTINDQETIWQRQSKVSGL